MRFLFLCLIICWFSFSIAKEPESKKNDSKKNNSEVGRVVKKKRNPSQEINYNTFSQDYPSDQLQGNVNQRQKNIEIISAKERDKILQRANLESVTSSWDHLEKDILILRALNNSFPIFQKKYPSIPKDKLYQLYLIVNSRNN